MTRREEKRHPPDPRKTGHLTPKTAVKHTKGLIAKYVGGDLLAGENQCPK